MAYTWTCETCERETDMPEFEETARQTWDSPAEYRVWCRDCATEARERDEAARDDWADRENDARRNGDYDDDLYR